MDLVLDCLHPCSPDGRTDMALNRITDAEAVSMSRFLVQRDGLFLGSSSACNLVACIKLVKKMGWNNGEKVVTVLCVDCFCSTSV